VSSVLSFFWPRRTQGGGAAIQIQDSKFQIQDSKFQRPVLRTSPRMENLRAPRGNSPVVVRKH
jgi:hypothetical protein